MYSDAFSYSAATSTAKTYAARLLSGFILLCITHICFGILRRKCTWMIHGRKLPPGPMPWPIVGNLPTLMIDRNAALAKLAKIYGPVYSLQLGSRPAIMFSTSEMVKEVCKTHDKCFGHRPFSSGTEAFSDDRTKEFYGGGDVYRDVKKIWKSEVLAKRPLESIKAREDRSEELRGALRGMLDSAEKSKQAGKGISINVSEYIIQVAGNVMTRAIFGKPLYTASYGDWETNNFNKLLKELHGLLVGYDLRDIFPFLKGIDLQRKDVRFKAVRTKLRDLLRVHIEARQEKLALQDDTGTAEDEIVLDVLYPKDPKKDVFPENLKFQTIEVLLIASIFSTGNVIGWALTELLRKPLILRECQEQLDAVAGRDRLVLESDLPKLPIIRAILLESTRLHPLAVYMVPRESAWDCEVGGYFIPAKTMALINVHVINRDPTRWPNPHEFNPDRHYKPQGGDADMDSTDFTLLNFGMGRRSCIGKSQAWLLLQITLARLVHTLDLEVADNIRPENLNMAETSRLDAARVDPLKVIPTLRLHRSALFEETF